MRLKQLAECRQLEDEVRAQFEHLNTDPVGTRNGAHLFSRIAVVVHGLDELPALRERAHWTFSPREPTLPT